MNTLCVRVCLILFSSVLKDIMWIWMVSGQCKLCTISVVAIIVCIVLMVVLYIDVASGTYNTL